MTNEEAIKELQILKGDMYSSIICKAIDNALDALEKRIPIRPIDGMSCPCGRTAVDRWSVYKFCPRCGQAIYWSDEREGMD